MDTSALLREQPSTEKVAPRPPGREHSSRMLGDGSPPSLTVDQAMLTLRPVAPVRLALLKEGVDRREEYQTRRIRRRSCAPQVRIIMTSARGSSARSSLRA